MTSTRDQRNWSKGYQEALRDIYAAMLRGDEEAAYQWIRDNTNDPDALEKMLKDHYDAIDAQS